jgi:hypothetical protein
MIETKRLLGSGIQEALFVLVARNSGSFTDNDLRDVNIVPSRQCTPIPTWSSLPGISAVMNCAKLYSLRAGKIPDCSDSSFAMMFRTSGKLDVIHEVNEHA